MTKFVLAIVIVCFAENAAFTQAAAPAPVNGGAASLTSGETPKSNLIQWFVKTSSDFDDNASNSSDHKTSDLVSSVHTGVDWSIIHQRWSWDLNYDPGFGYSLRSPDYSVLSQDLDTRLAVDLTQKLRLELHNSYLDSSNPIDYLESQLKSPQSEDQYLNNSLLGPLGRRQTESLGVQSSYALDRFTTIGVSGNYSFVNYQPPAGTVSLQDQTARSLSGFYSRQISRHQFSGIQISFADIGSLGGMVHTRVMRALYSHSFSITPTLALSADFGPQRAVSSIPATLSGTGGALFIGNGETWNFAGGGSLSWVQSHTQVSGVFNQQVEDGAGYLGAVQLRSFGATVRQTLNQRSSIRASVTMDTNLPLNGTTMTFPSIAYRSYGVSYSRQLSQRLTLSAAYWFDQHSGAGSQLAAVNRNRASIGLSYYLDKPIGR